MIVGFGRMRSPFLLVAVVAIIICSCASGVRVSDDDLSGVEVNASLSSRTQEDHAAALSSSTGGHGDRDYRSHGSGEFVGEESVVKNASLHYLTMIVGLAFLHVYVYQRDAPALVIVFVYCFYLFLHTSSSTMQVCVGKRNTNGGEMAQAIVFASLLIKVSVSTMLVGWESVRDGQSIKQVMTLFSAAKVIIIPACLYTTSDLVLVYAQQNTSMTEVQNFSRSVSMPLTCVVWVACFRIIPGAQKIIGLLIIMIGASTFSMGQSSHMGPSHSPSYMAPDWTGLGEVSALWVIRGLLMFQAVVATFAGVANEYFLLACPASVNMLNTMMYLCGMLFVLVQCHITGNTLPFEKMANFTQMEFILSCLHASTGIVTSYFLKYLGSIWKQVAFSVMMVMFFSVDIFWLGKVYSWVAVLGLLIGCIGTGLYILGGLDGDRGVVPPPTTTDSRGSDTAGVIGQPLEAEERPNYVVAFLTLACFWLPVQRTPAECVTEQDRIGPDQSRELAK